jgi:hypothetical protein
MKKVRENSVLTAKLRVPHISPVFARCGIPQSFLLDRIFQDEASGLARWNPTSRENRRDMWHPEFCSQGQSLLLQQAQALQALGCGQDGILIGPRFPPQDAARLVIGDIFLLAHLGGDHLHV